MLQLEGLVAGIPADLATSSTSCTRPPRHGVEEMRGIARRLRPEALEELGLQSALAALATGVRRPGRVRGPTAARTPGARARARARRSTASPQEALTDVARHAEATRGRAVDSNTTPTGAVLTVTDDGRGLRRGALPSASGVRGMRERAMLVGARPDDRARPGGGTEVHLRSPDATRSRTPLKTRILIADDHPVVLRGLRIVLTPARP